MFKRNASVDIRDRTGRYTEHGRQLHEVACRQKESRILALPNNTWHMAGRKVTAHAQLNTKKPAHMLPNVSRNVDICIAAKPATLPKLFRNFRCFSKVLRISASSVRGKV
jgi:hypothetical protein